MFPPHFLDDTFISGKTSCCQSNGPSLSYYKITIIWVPNWSGEKQPTTAALARLRGADRDEMDGRSTTGANDEEAMIV